MYGKGMAQVVPILLGILSRAIPPPLRLTLPQAEAAVLPDKEFFSIARFLELIRWPNFLDSGEESTEVKMSFAKPGYDVLCTLAYQWCFLAPA
jgi:hypothetical protein